jgi:hypothetical protein
MAENTNMLNTRIQLRHDTAAAWKAATAARLLPGEVGVETDTGKFKKSQKGLIWVGYDENGEIIAKDGYTTSTLPENSLLQPIFRDGKMLKETTLAEIRERLHNGDF